MEVKNEWISVNDRLPDFGVHVFVYGENPTERTVNETSRVIRFVLTDRKVGKDVWISKRVCPNNYTDGNGFFRVYGYSHLTITHWLPIPLMNGKEIFETL